MILVVLLVFLNVGFWKTLGFWLGGGNCWGIWGILGLFLKLFGSLVVLCYGLLITNWIRDFRLLGTLCVFHFITRFPDIVSISNMIVWILYVGNNFWKMLPNKYLRTRVNLNVGMITIRPKHPETTPKILSLVKFWGTLFKCLRNTIKITSLKHL